MFPKTKEQPNLEIKARQLQRLNIDCLEDDTKSLVKMVDFTSELADQISQKVRQLDLAKTRVFEAIQRVDDVLVRVENYIWKIISEK